MEVQIFFLIEKTKEKLEVKIRNRLFIALLDIAKIADILGIQIQMK